MAFLDRSLRSTVANSSVFVVGAGGIGCELLKNLVLTGFNNITVVNITSPFVRPSRDVVTFFFADRFRHD